jgi:hypothetical protein
MESSSSQDTLQRDHTPKPTKTATSKVENAPAATEAVLELIKNTEFTDYDIEEVIEELNARVEQRRIDKCLEKSQLLAHLKDSGAIQEMIR